MSLVRILFILLAFSADAQPIWVANEPKIDTVKVATCEGLMTVKGLEQRLLDVFNVREIISAKYLSTNVYLVTTKLGQSYVVRLPNLRNDTRQEQLATRFINLAPGVRVSKSRLLSDEDTNWIKRYFGLINIGGQASVTLFYETLKGSEYLKSLLRRSGSTADTFRDGDHHLVPAGVYQQLTDTWIMYTILGIPDFHMNNWLVHGEHVIGIDLARVGEWSSNFKMDPFTLDIMYDRLREKLSTSASPELIRYLKELTDARIREIALESNAVLIEEDLRTIRSNIQFFIEKSKQN